MQSLLNDTSDGFVVSAVSLWEIAIKGRLGKLTLQMSLENLPAQLAVLGIEILNLSLVHILTELEPSPSTNDLFDRMFLAVAQAERCQFVTLDQALHNHPLAWRPASA
jgi:PIN domain nuclease of toxin-antitoxin system